MKLYRDNSVLDSDLRIAAINTNAMAIDEIDSDEDRQSQMRRKKETLEMDDNLEILKEHTVQKVLMHEDPEIQFHLHLRHR